MIIAITRSWGQNKHVLDPSYLYLAPGSCLCHWAVIAELGAGVLLRAANDPSVPTITEKASTMPVSAFTFETLLRHHAKQAPKYGK